MESGSSINDIEDDDNEEFEKLSPGDISNILRFSADKKYKIQFLRSLVETKKNKYAENDVSVINKSDVFRNYQNLNSSRYRRFSKFS